MRVLMFNRQDQEESPGGDVVQMHKTAEALENIGVSVDFARSSDRVSLERFDIVHVFNLQMPSEAEPGFQLAADHRRPIVLSPIYWDLSDLYYSTARQTTKKWRLVAKVLPRNPAISLYKRWQQAKAPLNKLWRRQRELLSLSHSVLPNSMMEAQLLESTFRLNSSWSSKLTIVPNATDPAQFGSASEDSEIVKTYQLSGCVVEVGRISRAKNQLGLIEALFDAPLRIAFVGKPSVHEPDYYSACRARAAERGNVTFINHLAHSELASVYRAAAIHALPSWRETPGLASLEAAAAGTKVVTTCLGSAREYFGELAWYCHPGDGASIRNAVERALAAAPRPTLQQLVTNAYTWSEAAKRTLEGYEAAMRRSESVSEIA